MLPDGKALVGNIFFKCQRVHISFGTLIQQKLILNGTNISIKFHMNGNENAPCPVSVNGKRLASLAIKFILVPY